MKTKIALARVTSQHLPEINSDTCLDQGQHALLTSVNGQTSLDQIQRLPGVVITYELPATRNGDPVRHPLILVTRKAAEKANALCLS